MEQPPSSDVVMSDDVLYAHNFFEPRRRVYGYLGTLADDVLGRVCSFLDPDDWIRGHDFFDFVFTSCPRSLREWTANVWTQPVFYAMFAFLVAHNRWDLISLLLALIPLSRDGDPLDARGNVATLLPETSIHKRGSTFAESEHRGAELCDDIHVPVAAYLAMEKKTQLNLSDISRNRFSSSTIRLCLSFDSCQGAPNISHLLSCAIFLCDHDLVEQIVRHISDKQITGVRIRTEDINTIGSLANRGRLIPCLASCRRLEMHPSDFRMVLDYLCLCDKKLVLSWIRGFDYSFWVEDNWHFGGFEAMFYECDETSQEELDFISEVAADPRSILLLDDLLRKFSFCERRPAAYEIIAKARDAHRDAASHPKT